MKFQSFSEAPTTFHNLANQGNLLYLAKVQTDKGLAIHRTDYIFFLDGFQDPVLCGVSEAVCLPSRTSKVLDMEGKALSELHVCVNVLLS